MKVTLYGVSYTGAHFRGITDQCDSRDVKITVEGRETDITRYICDNFSYGLDDDAGVTMKEMVRAMKAAAKDDRSVSFSIQIFDGCGGILRIDDEKGKVLVDITKEFADPNNTDVEMLDLGSVLLNDVPNYNNHILRLLDAMEVAGTLPYVDQGEDR
jgi:hypothetical protein